MKTPCSDTRSSAVWQLNRALLQNTEFFHRCFGLFGSVQGVFLPAATEKCEPHSQMMTTSFEPCTSTKEPCISATEPYTCNVRTSFTDDDNIIHSDPRSTAVLRMYKSGCIRAGSFAGIQGFFLPATNEKCEHHSPLMRWPRVAQTRVPLLVVAQPVDSSWLACWACARNSTGQNFNSQLDPHIENKCKSDIWDFLQFCLRWHAEHAPENWLGQNSEKLALQFYAKSQLRSDLTFENFDLAHSTLCRRHKVQECQIR